MKLYPKKFMKKGISLLLATGLLFSNTPNLPIGDLIGTKEVSAAQFNMGKSGHWAETYMRNLYDRGLMRGDINGNMNPDKKITRAEFVSIVNRAFGYAQKGKMPFTDISGKEWYANDVATAYTQGYFLGNGIQSNATGSLTREEAVTMLGRNLHIEEQEGENFGFKDSRTIENWSKGYVNTAMDKKFISGYLDKSFRPKNSITRGEVSKVISDALGEIMNKPINGYYGYHNGNVTISTSNVTLRDTVINGDLYITEGVGTGHTALDNVTVTGEVIISGTGESNSGKSSLTFTDCHIAKMTISGTKSKLKTIKINGDTSVDYVKVMTNAFLEELANRDGGFHEIELDGPKNTKLELSGLFDKVTVKGEENQVILANGRVRELTVDEEAVKSVVSLAKETTVDRLLLDVGAKVIGTGIVSYLKVNADGSDIAMMPDEIEVRPGVTAKVKGVEMDTLAAEEASDGPRILADYPTIKEIGDTEVTAYFKSNKMGKVYWAVTVYDDGKISTEELIKPNRFNTKVVKGGNIATDSQKEYSVKISGLKTNVEYMISAVFVDTKDVESVRKIDSFTTLDNTKTGFVSGYPKIKELGSTYADIQFVTTKDCTAYWGVFPKGTIAPDATALKAQKLVSNINKGTLTGCKKSEEGILKISGLKELQEYDFYVMLSDGSIESAVAKLAIKTKDGTIPLFVGQPTVDSAKGTSGDIKFTVNEDAKVYYAAYATGTTFPIPPLGGTSASITAEEAKQQVKLGKNALKKGTSSAVKADTEGSLTLSGIKPEEDYDIYLVAEDASGNLSAIKSLSIGSKPNFLSGYPKVSSTSNSAGNISLIAVKKCTAYWAALPKGSVAPGENDLKNQKVAGAAKVGVTLCEKNIEAFAKVEGLKELAEYDYYVLVSDGQYNSKVSKLTFKTIDSTGPIFTDGFPKQSVITNLTVDVQVMISEQGSVYYLLCDINKDIGDLSAQETKELIINGGNGKSLKSGKLSVGQSTLGTIKLNGLTEATAYRVYLLAEDTYKNTSISAKMLEISTLDKTPPTAKVEFKDMVGKSPSATSEFYVMFSESVIDRDGRKALDKASLNRYLTIYDESNSKRPKLAIDLNLVEISITSPTKITFKQGAVTLKSGNNYQIKLNSTDIMDKAENLLVEASASHYVTTGSPMVTLEKIETEAYDMEFTIDKMEAVVADDMKYDITFESSENIEFELYRNGVKVGSSRTVGKNGLITLKTFTSPYNTFKDLKTDTYGVKVLAMDGIKDANKNWGKTLTMKIKCVMGVSSALDIIPSAGIEEAKKQGAKIVSDPDTFQIIRTFVDTNIPSFEGSDTPTLDDDYPKVAAVGDSFVTFDVMTDAKAICYYLIVPKGTVKLENIIKEQVVSGNFKVKGSVSGSFSVPVKNVSVLETISGLVPEGKYDAFFFLKGTPYDYSAIKQVSDITLAKTAPPEWIGEKAKIIERGKDYVKVRVLLDKYASIDWAVYNKGTDITDPNIIHNGVGSVVKGTNVTTKVSPYTVDITIKGLEYGIYYAFYAVATNPYCAEDSAIISLTSGVTPADNECSTFTLSTAIENTGGVPYAPYIGTVTIKFSEPLYYAVDGDQSKIVKMEKEQFDDCIAPSVGKENVTLISYVSGSGGTTAIFKFKEAVEGSTITANELLTDATGNLVENTGTISIRFKNVELDGKHRALSFWEKQK